MLRPVLFALLLSLLTVPAQAWTRAHVARGGRRAFLEKASLGVRLTLSMEVGEAGWERLELPGLAGLPGEADQIEASLQTTDGSVIRPESPRT